MSNAAIDITDLSDNALDALLGIVPECRFCGTETSLDDQGIDALLCVPCADARPDESYLSWGDHDPNYDY